MRWWLELPAGETAPEIDVDALDVDLPSTLTELNPTAFPETITTQSIAGDEGRPEGSRLKTLIEAVISCTGASVDNFDIDALVDEYEAVIGPQLQDMELSEEVLDSLLGPVLLGFGLTDIEGLPRCVVSKITGEMPEELRLVYRAIRVCLDEYDISAPAQWDNDALLTLLDISRGPDLEQATKAFLVDSLGEASVPEGLPVCMISTVSELMGPSEDALGLALSGVTPEDWWNNTGKLIFKRGIAIVALDDEELFKYVNVASWFGPAGPGNMTDDGEEDHGYAGVGRKMLSSTRHRQMLQVCVCGFLSSIPLPPAQPIGFDCVFATAPPPPPPPPHRQAGLRMRPLDSPQLHSHRRDVRPSALRLPRFRRRACESCGSVRLAPGCLS